MTGQATPVTRPARSDLLGALRRAQAAGVTVTVRAFTEPGRFGDIVRTHIVAERGPHRVSVTCPPLDAMVSGGELTRAVHYALNELECHRFG